MSIDKKISLLSNEALTSALKNALNGSVKDKEAFFADVYKRSYLDGILAHANDDVAKDVAQNVALKFLEKYFISNALPNYDNIKGLVVVMTKNFTINYFRKSSTRNKVPVDDGLYVSSNDDADDLTLCNDVSAVIESVPHEEFMLHTNGFKYKEIAKMYNIPVGTVKSRVFRTRKDVKDFYADDTV